MSSNVIHCPTLQNAQNGGSLIFFVSACAGGALVEEAGRYPNLNIHGHIIT